MPSQYRQKRDQLIANADSIEVLILGSSHAADGVDPNQFTLYAHNLAFGSQSIYFDRKLAEKYLPDLPNLKYVLLALDYNSLYGEHDENRDFFYKYYYGVNYKERKFYKESILQSFFVYTPEQTLSLMLSNRQDVLVKGWLNDGGRNDIAVMSEEKNKLRADGFNYKIKTWKGGDAVLNDLEELIKFILSKDVTPVLITYPNYLLLNSMLDESVIERNRKIGNELSKKYQILYLDYFNDESFIVSDFFNCDHLNSDGAAKLSRRINEEIINEEKNF